jgi:hypothetical protein
MKNETVILSKVFVQLNYPGNIHISSWLTLKKRSLVQ